MTTLQDLKDKLAAGQKLNKDDALFLLDLQVEKKGGDYVYVDGDGKEVEPFLTGECANLHYKHGKNSERAGVEARTSNSGMGNALDWEPGCLVGSVFVDLLGIAAVPIDGDAMSTNEETGSPFDREAVYALSIAQSAQDNACTWGLAVQKAQASDFGNP